MDNINNYLNEKQFKGSEVMQSAIMFLLSAFLIGGGIIIINDEDIFKKIYEGYQGTLGIIGSTIPVEEQIIYQSGSVTSTSLCDEGYEKYSYSLTSGAAPQYFCAKCPNGRNLQYSDGTSVSPGALNSSKFVSGLRCKLPEPDGTGGPPSESVIGLPRVPAPAPAPAPAPTPAGSQVGLPAPSRSTQVSNSWTADLPDDLTLAKLQKNIGNLRKKSDFNIAIAEIMIIIGCIISIYQIYTLFIS